MKPPNTCVKSQLDIEVLRVDAKGSLQRWNSDRVIDALPVPIDLAVAVARAPRVAMDIEFDDTAQPVRLVNGAEIRSLLNSGLEAVTQEGPGKKPLDPARAAVVKTLVSKVTDSDESLLALVALDVTILYSPIGSSFPLGKTVSAPSSLPSPFGSGRVQSTIAATAKAAAPDGTSLELSLVEDIDRAAFTKAADAAVKEMIPAASRPEAMAKMKKRMESLKVRRVATYTSRLGSPWAAQVQWRQTIESDGLVRVDAVDFKRVR